jgi:general secretion pathway protein I
VKFPSRNIFATRPRRAFTLPEVLAALVLIGVVLPAVMRGISLSIAAADDARKRVQAVSLAETKLSELTAAAMSTSSGGTSGDFGADFPGFRWEASSQEVQTELAEIRVRVSWQGRGLSRNVDLASFAYVSGTAGTVTSTPSTAAGGSR